MTTIIKRIPYCETNLEINVTKPYNSNLWNLDKLEVIIIESDKPHEHEKWLLQNINKQSDHVIAPSGILEYDSDLVREYFFIIAMADLKKEYFELNRVEFLAKDLMKEIFKLDSLFKLKDLNHFISDVINEFSCFKFYAKHKKEQILKFIENLFYLTENMPIQHDYSNCF